MAAQHDIMQSDDQFMAVTDAMDKVAEVIETNGTDALLVINLGPNQKDAIMGGHVTQESIQLAQDLLSTLANEHGTDAFDGIIHCKV